MALDCETSGLDDDSEVRVVSFCDSRSYDCISFSEHNNDNHLIAALDLCDKYSSRLTTFNGSGFDFRMIANRVEDGHDKRRAARHALRSYDIMLDFACTHGYFSSLNSFAEASLGTQKNGDGATAIEDWDNKQYDKVVEYCENDARLTAQIYSYGMSEGSLARLTKAGKKNTWSLPLDGFRTAMTAVKEYRNDPPDVSWMSDPPNLTNTVKWAVDMLTA